MMPENDNPLVNAIVANDLPGVKRAVANGADLNVRYELVLLGCSSSKNVYARGLPLEIAITAERDDIGAYLVGFIKTTNALADILQTAATREVPHTIEALVRAGYDGEPQTCAVERFTRKNMAIKPEGRV